MSDIICEFAETCELPSCFCCPIKKDPLSIALCDESSKHFVQSNVLGEWRINIKHALITSHEQAVRFAKISQLMSLLRN